MKEIKISKVINGRRQAATVEERYLSKFTNDGWEVVSETVENVDEDSGGLAAGRRSDSDVESEPIDRSAISKLVDEKFGDTLKKPRR